MEIPSDEGEDRDSEIGLARVEFAEVADYGFQLIKYKKPLQIGEQAIKWSIYECIWNMRGELVVLGHASARKNEMAAKKFIEAEAKHLASDPLIESYEPSSAQKVAEAGKWLALKDVHPKTVAALGLANSASGEKEQLQRAKLLGTAAGEFGKEFYSLRKKIVWPVKENKTVAVWPLDTVSAAERKSIGRRKPRPNYVNRYMATGWVPNNLADLTAAELADHINKKFHTNFTPQQIGTRRKRLELFVPWEGSHKHKSQI